MINTVDGGTSGDAFISAEEKAHREAMKTVATKDVKDWTLDEQKAAADDIAKNGSASKVYAKAKAAMDAGTTWSVKLTNGKALQYRIIGINHDDLADGSGKAGLTFEATNTALGLQRMNATSTNAGGWEDSELRGRLNSGDLWALLPAELAGKVETVAKMTDNKGGGSVSASTATTDKLFLLSSTELWGNVQSDGIQYEYYRFKGVTESDYSEVLSGDTHWTRSVNPSTATGFRYVYSDGSRHDRNAAHNDYAFIAFCF